MSLITVRQRATALRKRRFAAHHRRRRRCRRRHYATSAQSRLSRGSLARATFRADRRTATRVAATAAATAVAPQDSVSLNTSLPSSDSYTAACTLLHFCNIV